jgi:hypothetical protein
MIIILEGLAGNNLVATQVGIYLQGAQDHHHPVSHKSHAAYPVKQNMS